MTAQKRILVLYTSGGGLGHKVLALNFESYLRQIDFSVRGEDLFHLERGTGVQVFVKIQRYINQHLPFLWRWIYRYGYLLSMPFRTMIIAANTRHVQSVIQDFQPDLIISVQTSTSAVVSYLKAKGLYHGLLAIAFSDFHFHRYWMYPHTDHYFANIEEQKQELIKRRIPAQNVTVSGMTLKPKPAIDISSVRDKVGVSEDERLVLISSGGQGFGMSDNFLDSLTDSLLSEAGRQNIKLKIAIICGKNKISYDRLTKRVIDLRVMVFGYYSPMSELYAITNLYITKPGGLSVTEALQWGIPLLITHWLPGQEELNYDYLVEKGLIMPGPKNPYDWKFQDVAEIAIKELKTGDFKNSLLKNPAKSSLVQESRENPFLKAIYEMFH